MRHESRVRCSHWNASLCIDKNWDCFRNYHEHLSSVLGLKFCIFMLFITFMYKVNNLDYIMIVAMEKRFQFSFAAMSGELSGIWLLWTLMLS